MAAFLPADTVDLCSQQVGLQASCCKVCFVRPAGVVKMRRGQVATFMLQVQSMTEVYQIFHQFATTITLKYALSTHTLKVVHIDLMLQCESSGQHIMAK